MRAKYMARYPVSSTFLTMYQIMQLSGSMKIAVQIGIGIEIVVENLCQTNFFRAAFEPDPDFG